MSIEILFIQRGQHRLVRPLSRFPAATRVQTTVAPPVIKALKNIYEAYGNPERHRTDNGPRFSKSKGIEHVETYPYHPQVNASETFIKPLEKALKTAYCSSGSSQDALDDLLMA